MPQHKLARRAALQMAACAVSAPWLGALAAAPGTIVLGQSAALTGPLADLGKAISAGSKLYFDQLNARGGIKGRKVTLTTLDDAYDVKKSQTNLTAFFDDKSLFGLFTVMGTPMVDAAMAQIKETGTLMFSPFTGALSARPAGVRNIINLRASYADEAVQLIKHLSTLGMTKVALVTQNNAFGKEILNAATSAMAQINNKPVAATTVENNASDAVAAADKMASTNAGALIIGLAGKPALEFIKAVRIKQPGLSLYALSILGAAGTIAAMGAEGVGVTLTQVVPLPSRESITAVREFKQAFMAAKQEVEPSHLVLEGYLNARTFAVLANKVNGPLTPKAFIDATWASKRVDIGGIELNFTEPGTSASRFIELTMIARGGGFVR